MTAFNTATNTGSATFTNAYSTVSLLASDTVQKAAGFSRTSGWRYYEVAIDDQGGDFSRVFTGYDYANILTRLTMYGGPSAKLGIDGGTFGPPAPYTANIIPGMSVTACTGDVFMFSVDMTGGGRNHAGVQIIATLTTAGFITAIPLLMEIGKNGAWLGEYLYGYAAPAYGMPMRYTPWVARDSTSAPPAVVSLRVATTSFAYAIPAGAVAWGDGPEGSTAVVPFDDFGLAWDPGQLSRVSLSGSNLYAVNNATGEFPTTGYVMSLNFAGLTGKRYMEFTLNPVGNLDWAIGLFDATTVTNTAFDQPSNAFIYKFAGQVFRRGVDVSNSVTFEGLNPFTDANVPGCGMALDFDNKLWWFMQPYGSGGGAWVGDAVVPATGGAQPWPYSWGAFSSVAGIAVSLTVSTTIIRVGAKIRQSSPAAPMYINGGQLPFGMYPLLPGMRSLNGGRQVTAGQGDSWDVVNNPASSTYGASGLSILKRYLGAAQCARTNSAGKKYFEIHTEQDSGGAGVYLGIRKDTATTFTNANIGPLLDQAVVVEARAAGGRNIRYGVVTGSWTASSGYYSSGTGYMAAWHGVAVDFDAGSLWVGSWNYATRTMNWGAASNPATGVSPHATFTAGQAMRVAIIDHTNLLGGGAGGIFGRVNLVQDDNNVVGLPSGFTTWGGTAAASLTATPSPSPSASLASAARNIWPTGVV